MKTDYRNTSMLDMIFENRNKEYGAYVLRQDYDKNMKRAVGFTFSTILLVFASVFIVNVLKAEKVSLGHEVVSTPKDIPLVVEKVKIEEKKIAPQNTAKPKPTILNTERNVVPTEQAEVDSVPDTDDLAIAESGLTTNLNGKPGDGIEGGTGTGTSLEPVFTVEKPIEKPLIFAEVMPKFPGGDQALLAFLSKNTQYPTREKEMDIEGRVLVKFVVNEDGSISNAFVDKSDSKGFSNEALRVVGKLPKFEPGMQQGRPVKVQFSLPFKWKIN